MTHLKHMFLHCAGILLAMLTALHAADRPSPANVDYNRDVRPILSDNCFYCHGNDPHHRKAKLRLDVREDALAILRPYYAARGQEINDGRIRMARIPLKKLCTIV